MPAGGCGTDKLALLCGLLIAFIAAVGLWDKAMTTVYLCAISAFFSCLIGIPLGVVATRSAWFDRVQRVVVDTLQTLPSFVYLIPVVMLFRVGDVTALIAIVAFAVTPAIRYTIHGIRQVPPHLIEAAIATGCTRRQILWRVQLPLALPGDHARHQPDHPVRAIDAGDHRAGRHARPGAGGLYSH